MQRRHIGMGMLFMIILHLHAQSLTTELFGYINQPTNPITHIMIMGGYRAYQPATGQFLKQDSDTAFYRPTTLNGFNYAAGNPIFLIGRTGHMPETITETLLWFSSKIRSVLASRQETEVIPEAWTENSRPPTRRVPQGDLDSPEVIKQTLRHLSLPDPHPPYPSPDTSQGTSNYAIGKIGSPLSTTLSDTEILTSQTHNLPQFDSDSSEASSLYFYDASLPGQVTPREITPSISSELKTILIPV